LRDLRNSFYLGQVPNLFYRFIPKDCYTVAVSTTSAFNETTEQMSIDINLSPEIETKLLEKAAAQGQDAAVLAAELLREVLGKPDCAVDSWANFAERIEADPLFEEFVEDMAAYRRELDAEVAAHQVALEMNQPA
jgi:hypothetical protein